MARVAVVGAGPAGCLTARRLADAGHHVTLFEAGERLIPTLDFASLLDRADLRWPAEHAQEGAASNVIRAHVVGGASAINGMLLSAPDSTDLASWDTALGLSDGSSRSSLERVIAEVAPQMATPGPLARLISEAAIDSGATIGGSTLDVDAQGLLAVASAARSGERRDAAAVYLHDATPQRGAGEVRLVTGTAITSLDDPLLSGFDHVVVSAGALASPVLLSSVVPDLAPSPAQQHLAVAVSVSLGPGQRVEREQQAVSRVLRWSSGLDPADGRADVQLVVLDHMGWHPAGRSHGLVIVSLLSGSTLGEPTTPLDQRRLRVGVRRALALLQAGGFEPADHGFWGPSHLDHWIAAQPNPVHHVTSTLPLGSACGRAGLVAGRSNLSVIDASVLPASPRADTNMAVLVIADLLAAQLLDHIA